LLEHYLNDILQFSIDRSAEVRKTVTGFIEESGLLLYCYQQLFLCLLCNLIYGGNIYLIL